MKSSLGSGSGGVAGDRGEDEEEGEAEESEGFDDFTIASSWERFIAGVEGACREWQAAGSANLLSAGAEGPLTGSGKLYRVHKEIKFGQKLYVLIFFFEADGAEKVQREDWRDWEGLHHLQLWFGAKDFLVAAPVSSNGVILDSSEATMLLSTVAVALSSCGSDWPAFVPVHDPMRKAYKGIQATRSSYSTSFEADCIGSWVPVRFMHLEGLYELFVSKVAFTAPNSAAIPALKVGFTLRLTYRTAMPGFEYQNKGNNSPTAKPIPEYDGDLPDESLWDENSPWAEWHSVEDPIKGFELIAMWIYRSVSSPWEMAEYENESTFDADKWLLRPIFAQHQDDSERQGYVGRLEALVAAFQMAGEAEFMEDFVVESKLQNSMRNLTVPPASVLERVVKDLFYDIPAAPQVDESTSYQAHSVKGAPADSLLGRFCLHCLRFGSCNIRSIAVLWIEFVREVRWCWDESQPLPRVSAIEPPDLATCLLHQKLQLLAVCIQLKSAEKSSRHSGPSLAKEEPTKSPNIVPALSQDEAAVTADVLEVETQIKCTKDNADMILDLGKGFKNSEDACAPDSWEHEFEGAFGLPSSISESGRNTEAGTDVAANMGLEDEIREKRRGSAGPSSISESGKNTEVDTDVASNMDLEDEIREKRRGSAGPFGNLLLLHSKHRMHAPIRQKPPLMTVDMLQEREQAIAALSKSPSEKVARARLQTDVLASDVAAFKAANPGAVFEDFVRWNSPHDWLEGGESDAVESSDVTGSPAKGAIQGRLSSRMLEPDNPWFQNWENVSAQPVSEQKLLFDYSREAEKVIHYLDTLKPQDLLTQMICTSFMIAADAIKQAHSGDLPRLSCELEELFTAIDSSLQPGGAFNKVDPLTKQNYELLYKDLLQLCKRFAVVEEHVFVGLSLFQKLNKGPQLLATTFDNYLENGKHNSGVLVRSVLGQNDRMNSLDSSFNERSIVAGLFCPSKPSVYRSSRMGNFLNGLEPVVREIRFQFNGEDSASRRYSRNERSSVTRIPSHQMYICGTSDDLLVALSVVSKD